MVGMKAKLGFGKETTFGTAVSSGFFFNAGFDIQEERQRLREAFLLGTRGMASSCDGRLRINGNVPNVAIRPEYAGMIFRALLGAPTTSGSDPYTHVFEDSTAKFSTDVALPPYTCTAETDSNEILRFAGGQLNQLTLRQRKDDFLYADMAWIFKSVATTTTESISLESGCPFLFSDLAVTRNGSAYGGIEELTLTINNNLETFEELDESNTIVGTDFASPISVQLALTLNATESGSRSDFVTPTKQEWVLTWDNGTDSLTITLPQISVEQRGKPVQGAGRILVNYQGMAEYNSSDGNTLEVSLLNTTASY